MILTVTLNPAVDISYQLEELELDGGNRVKEVSKTAGGKGLNVARVSRQLGEEVAASGFLGGELGNFIRSEIQKQNIKDHFLNITGHTRNCIAILHDEGKQTEILEAGPRITKEEAQHFIKNFPDIIKDAQMITLNGSLPRGLDENFYAQLIDIAKTAGKTVFLDTGGSTTRKILKTGTKPNLIKPNESEFLELIGKKRAGKSDLIQALQAPIFEAIDLVVITRGALGALVKRKEEIYEARIPEVKAINPVGSGDASLAGFALAIKRGYQTEETISYGLTLGVLNAMEETTGLVNVNKIPEVKSLIKIKRIK